MISEFVKAKRKSVKLKQAELAAKSGVGLRFLRELEQEKTTVRLDKVNLVLRMFGHQAEPMKVYVPEKVNH